MIDAIGRIATFSSFSVFAVAFLASLVCFCKSRLLAVDVTGWAVIDDLRRWRQLRGPPGT